MHIDPTHSRRWSIAYWCIVKRAWHVQINTSMIPEVNAQRLRAEFQKVYPLGTWVYFPMDQPRTSPPEHETGLHIALTMRFPELKGNVTPKAIAALKDEEPPQAVP